jgi:hypothetical protein
VLNKTIIARKVSIFVLKLKFNARPKTVIYPFMLKNIGK